MCILGSGYVFNFCLNMGSLEIDSIFSTALKWLCDFCDYLLITQKELENYWASLPASPSLFLSCCILEYLIEFFGFWCLRTSLYSHDSWSRINSPETLWHLILITDQSVYCILQLNARLAAATCKANLCFFLLDFSQINLPFTEVSISNLERNRTCNFVSHSG